MKTIKHLLILCAAVVLLATLIGGCGDGDEQSSVSSVSDETYSASSSEDEKTSAPSSKGLEFQLSDDGESYSVTGIGTCTDTDVVMPAIHKGKFVTGIGEKAFEDCTGLTNITVPDSVISIGDYAFSGCNGLTSITIPDSVTNIGVSAFSHTAYYNDASNWTDGVLYIGSALIECKSDKTGTVSIKEGTTCIAGGAFERCSDLTNITIPDSVTGIGTVAFFKCSGLTNITIPDSVTSIDQQAFRGCSGLTNITIPNSVTHIGKRAFEGCLGRLTSLTVAKGNSVYHSDGDCLIETASKTLIAGCQNSVIPTDGSVTNIGTQAFYGCTGLTSITIPDSVTSIGDYVFYNCKSLTSITIPDSVTSIGYSAFDGCTGLTSITIPASVTSIDWSAFSGCTGLTDIPFTGTMEQWNAISKGNGWNDNTGSYVVHCTDGDISK